MFPQHAIILYGMHVFQSETGGRLFLVVLHVFPPCCVFELKTGQESLVHVTSLTTCCPCACAVVAMRTNRHTRVLLLIMTMIFLCVSLESPGLSPPGKPQLLGCRSPEKETFTCWWKPGSDRGLQTTHHLYYEREDMEGEHECPDYRSGGSNSCFFNKNFTSIWVDYYLTVVASNALGNVTSDPLKFDVMEILKPDAPAIVTLQVEKKKDSLCLHVQWEHPSNTDTRSGWVTIKYQLRVKQESSNNWNNYTLGKHNHFNLYSISPGEVYMVQVRCVLDHGSWSEWSNTTSVAIPDYFQSERHVWIALSVFSMVPLLASLCVLLMKGKHVKQLILPPVPSPKIRGVDAQLLQNGKDEDILNALIFHDKYPPVVAWKDMMEEYLIVCDKDNMSLLDHSDSLKRKNCVPIPGSFHLDLKIQCMESFHGQNDVKKVKESTNVKDSFGNYSSEESLLNSLLTPKQTTRCMDLKSVDQQCSTTENTIQQISTRGGYVDLQRHESSHEEGILQKYYSTVKDMNGDNMLTLYKENVPLSLDIQRQEDNIPEDYSRVNDVNSGNLVFLQKQNDVTDSSVKDISNSICDTQRVENGLLIVPRKSALCAESISHEYVDCVPTPPLI